MSMLEEFDRLVEYGFRVIPLRRYTKIPVCRNWNTNWDFALNRSIVSRSNQCNIGVLLGKIIDVEGDNIEANEKIIDLIGDYPHPCYTSSKSIHHLFINPDSNLTILKHGHIEFRANRHQSVLPPSKTKAARYRWIQDITIPIPVMPKNLLNFYQKLRYKVTLKPNHLQLPCSKCKQAKYIHEKRWKLEMVIFKDLGLRWQCHECRVIDLRPICRKLRSKILA
jgi:hypothetical protein